MNLQSLMRVFSIRQRMLSAIGVVLLLLAMVGSVGWWGMQRQAAVTDAFVSEAFKDNVALSRLRLALADMSRYEKDMVIQHASPEQLSQANMHWEKARDDLGKGLGHLLQTQGGEEGVLVATMQEHLQAYVAEAGPVVDRIRSGAFESATVANRNLEKAQERYALLLGDMKTFQENLESKATGVQTESLAASERTRVWFGVAVLLAVVVVVPTTLANMQSICQPLEQAQRVASAITSGDLTQPIKLTGRDELTALMKALTNMQASLASIVGEVRRSTDRIGMSSGEITSGNQDLSTRTEQTASNLQLTASSMEELTSTVRNSADAAQQANQLAASASEIAVRGGQVVGQVVTTMEAINHSSKKISDIIGVIDGIAFQTNILALNAAVEAARAGEQGRGFAVVASEVRSLAQRSAEAAKEIKGLIGTSVDKVEAGSRLVADAGQTMSEIVGSVQRVSDIIGEITAASGEQSDGIAQVNVAVSQLDQMTQQNAALVEQSAAAAESLKDQAQKLAQVVQVFRLSEASEAPVLAAVPARPPARALPTPVQTPKAEAPRPAQKVAPAPAPAVALKRPQLQGPSAAKAKAASAPAASSDQRNKAAASAVATASDDGDWESF